MQGIIQEMENSPVCSGLLCATFLLLYLFVNTMTVPLHDDEQIFVTAGYMMRSVEIYRDFAIMQMPYLPILYDGLFRLFQADHLLLVGRLTSLFFSAANCVLLWLIVFRITRSYAVSHIATLIFGFSCFIQDIGVLAANYMMPMCATLFGVLFYERILGNPKFLLTKMYCLGLILAVATGSKLYYAAFFLPFLICSLIFPRQEKFSRKIARQATPLFVGFLVGLIPVIHYISHYTWAFLYNNFKYPIMELGGHGFGLGEHVGHRLGSLFGILLTNPSNLAFVAIFLLVLFKSIKSSGFLGVIRLRKNPLAMLSATSIVVGFLAAMTPAPTQVSHFAAGFPFVIVFLSCLIGAKPLWNWSITEKSVLAISILVMFGSASVVFFERLGTFRDPLSWTPLRAHAVGEKIKSELGSKSLRGKVATFSPLYAVEARLRIYPQFVTGPYAYRTDKALSAQQIDRIKAVSPMTLDLLFRKEKPAAIIVGQDRAMDASLEEYGKASGFSETDLGGFRLFSMNERVNGARKPEAEEVQPGRNP